MDPPLAKVLRIVVLVVMAQTACLGDFLTKDRAATSRYLGSPEFAARKAALSRPGSRGVLVPAGGRAQMAGAYLLLRFMREALHSSLPAEVVYNGPGELDARMRGFLASLPNVTLVDGSAVALPPHHSTSQSAALKHGWSFKVWALCYATSFTQVLMIDADNTPLVPPETLFDTPQWRAHGNLFWPDFMRGGEGILWKPLPGIFRKLGLPVPWEGPGGDAHRTVESGQVLLDRGAHADVLEWLWYMNSHHADWKAELHGDKDTFEIAFMLANKTAEFAQVKVHARQALGYVKHEDKYHHRGMIQHAPDGRLAFHHRTSGAKVMEHCSGDERGVEGCRVVYITSQLSIEQTMKCSHQAWTWNSHDVDVNAWDNLICTHNSSSVPAPASNAGQPAAAGHRKLAVWWLPGSKKTPAHPPPPLPNTWMSWSTHRTNFTSRPASGPMNPSPAAEYNGPGEFLGPGITCRRMADRSGVWWGTKLSVFPVEVFGKEGQRIQQSYALFELLREELRKDWPSPSTSPSKGRRMMGRGMPGHARMRDDA
uniref:Uncharacterized protein n=1 Tax=Chlamydomonas leiostraca TaxID=1034604 RepID=A0A7S0R6P1_9CHLO|mmetsp:Transcript_15253/g.38017  ORF Transcript_15253/g.38017 Transcript_15253/m.38017 type:complete len:539 (+) Transcript_15253:198-1814(+)|eukprot:CAMPEP_0202881414 /NCGR_PEP_ID=MMETSP1391-20130828/36507_1 /ASSEMBLY_ACC=CAM_ASM_000867 /TAXON_ID=1034604 /ORGANISM="Chlamydomonas leiostraca, Strain SAG 11-49" /LENGTH=538 /DNA_ID=CAMNT_0049564099 /DNA_START=113 /DNA_END=1729 /DNA_ORIENTATION=+